LAILRNFPQEKKLVSYRLIMPKSFDSSIPWGYFDGIAIGDEKNVEVILSYISIQIIF